MPINEPPINHAYARIADEVGRRLGVDLETGDVEMILASDGQLPHAETPAHFLVRKSVLAEARTYPTLVEAGVVST